MHVLITADTVGGVWTYTRELVTGLVGRGHRVTLISFGKVPSPAQTAWMTGLDRLDYRPTDFRLEWMQDAQEDIESSMQFVDAVIREVRPNLLHFSQYAYGALSLDIPRVVVAHSDVVSWWVAVHNEEPPDTEWARWYRETVTHGLAGADLVVAPSQWMLEQLCQYYERPADTRVVHNGRSADLFDPQRDKENFVLAAGRVWDQGKQVSLLLEREQRLPVCIAGSQEHPDRVIGGYTECGARPGVHFCGPQTEAQMRELYARASAYAATSCYEPFGLAPVEAALSRCALIANDLPVFHELWGDSAYYFKKNDAEALSQAIASLASKPGVCREYANRAYERALAEFRTDRMIDQYERLYAQLVPQEVAA